MRSGLCITSQFRVWSFGLRVRRLETLNSKLETVLQFRSRHLFDHVSLDLVGDLHVVKILEADAAFKSFADFRHIVLEAPQRSDAALPGNHAVANQAGPRVAANGAVDDHAT